MEDKENTKTRSSMTKTRKAFDWVCACLIRLPIIVILLGLALGFSFFLTYFIAPENAQAVLNFLGLA